MRNAAHIMAAESAPFTAAARRLIDLAAGLDLNPQVDDALHRGSVDDLAELATALFGRAQAPEVVRIISIAA